LRAMSSHRAFHWAYGGDVTARKIGHFLILNPQCPRSLLTCVDGMVTHLERLDRGYRRQSSARSQARSLLAELAEAEVGDIFDEGLHEFLSRFIQQTGKLAFEIHESYLNGDIR
jgi:uncharacterized alpha-E superfamily protein